MSKKNMFIFQISLLFLFIVIPVQAQESSSLNVVQKYIEYLNHHNWNEVADSWVQDQKENLLSFFENKENQVSKKGLFNIKRAKLVMWKKLPYEYAKNYFPTRYIERFKDKEVFICWS